MGHGLREEKDLLLIETFEMLLNPNENGHLVTGGRFLYVRINRNQVFLPTYCPPIDMR